MLFSSRLAKFGKGENLSAIMFSPDLLSIYYFEKGITRKDVHLDTMTLERVKVNLPYREVIPVDQNTFVTRLDKSIGVKNEQ